MEFRFPMDLVDLQEAWLRTYDALATLPGEAATTALRRRLITLSCRLYAHPYWSVPGRSRAAGTALRRQARSRAWARAA